MDERSTHLFTLLLRISCFFVFIGRAWQHLFWDAPFRAFFWDQQLLEGLVGAVTGLAWFEYVTHPATDQLINALTRGFGVFYLLMALLTLWVRPGMRWAARLYNLSTFLLAVLALLYCKEKFYQAAQFFEYALQFLAPMFFSLALFSTLTKTRLLFYMKVAVALTFVSHGLYAFGFYPRPGVFLDMTIHILGVSEEKAHQFLKFAGILDFILGVGIFLPRYSQYFLLYATFWGFSTAIARTWANVVYDPFSLDLLHHYLYRTIYRLPHGLVPLVIGLFQAQVWRDREPVSEELT